MIRKIVEDLRLYGGSTWYRRVLVFLGRPAFRVIFWYRIAHHFWARNRPLFYHFAILRMSKFGCYIHPNATLGRHIKLAHPVGVVIGAGTIVEDGCTLYQNVTLGADGSVKKYPLIEKGVTIFASATVLGGCTVGEWAVIGANSVVLKDVPSRATAKGNPATY